MVLSPTELIDAAKALERDAAELEPGGERHHVLTMAAAAADELAGWVGALQALRCRPRDEPLNTRHLAEPEQRNH